MYVNIDCIDINDSSSRCLAEVRLRSRARSCGICAERSGSETDFNPNT